MGTRVCVWCVYVCVYHVGLYACYEVEQWEQGSVCGVYIYVCVYHVGLYACYEVEQWEQGSVCGVCVCLL